VKEGGRVGRGDGAADFKLGTKGSPLGRMKTMHWYSQELSSSLH